MRTGRHVPPLLWVPVDQNGAKGFLSGLDLHVQEIAEQDWLLAVLAGTAQPHDSAKMIALGASSLAEVTYVALRAFIDGVCHECGSLAKRLSKNPFL